MKFCDVLNALFICSVALFARAWIEMPLFSAQSRNLFVALFARAWIEIAFIR